MKFRRFPLAGFRAFPAKGLACAIALGFLAFLSQHSSAVAQGATSSAAVAIQLQPNLGAAPNTPIPEAGTYGMMLAGAAMLCIWRKVRRVTPR